jgi:hypothetical protein
MGDGYMNITEGTLHYDETQDRLYAVYGKEETHYFHCGEALQIWFNDAWEDTRAEYDESAEPYLPHYYRSEEIPDGLRVRFYE